MGLDGGFFVDGVDVVVLGSFVSRSTIFALSLGFDSTVKFTLRLDYACWKNRVDRSTEEIQRGICASKGRRILACLDCQSAYDIDNLVADCPDDCYVKIDSMCLWGDIERDGRHYTSYPTKPK